MASPTKPVLTAAIQAVLDIGDAIRDLGTVPSGELYARLMPVMTLHQYLQVLEVLTRAKLITVESNRITWVGPAKPATEEPTR